MVSSNLKATVYKELEIPMPGCGGLNIKDLKLELEPHQSPDMLNMIYRNGHLCKRYGQMHWKALSNDGVNHNINDVGYYNDEVYLATDGGIYVGKLGSELDLKLTNSELGKASNCFFSFNRTIYYYAGFDSFYYHDLDSTDETFWKKVEPYIPDIVINRKPDGTYHDLIENYNRLGAGFKNTFHGDGESTVYVLTDKKLDNVTPIITVDEQIVTEFEFDAEKGEITFKTAPIKGTNNVEITAYKTVSEEHITAKYYKAYGGANNSRVFFGGCGNGAIYYSQVFDATYLPSQNYFRVGNDEEDITGFGEQYDVLMVFKPREIYSLEYYQDYDGVGQFQTKLVNPEMGCDAPKTIQLINNQLTWLSTRHGICTLVSTAIEDERNVRIISRNIDNGVKRTGLLQEHNLKDATSIDYDNKYMLSVNDKMYVWDYLMTPYYNSGKLEEDAKRLAWFLWDNFNVDYFIVGKDGLYYSKDNQINKLEQDFDDFGEVIHSHYQTPYLQFEAVPYLKTIKNIYVQTLSDVAVLINMKYFTEETPNGELEPEPIRIYDKLWHAFRWDTFGWSFTNIAQTFRRKCSLKKIQMCSVRFDNDELAKDMPLTHIAFQYTLVKNIK